MKELMIQMAIANVNSLLMPVLKIYAAKTDTKIDDVFVDALAAVLADPRLLEEFRKAINA